MSIYFLMTAFLLDKIENIEYQLARYVSEYRIYCNHNDLDNYTINNNKFVQCQDCGLQIEFTLDLAWFGIPPRQLEESIKLKYNQNSLSCNEMYGNCITVIKQTICYEIGDLAKIIAMYITECGIVNCDKACYLDESKNLMWHQIAKNY